jgi:hypothetical protein
MFHITWNYSTVSETVRYTYDMIQTKRKYASIILYGAGFFSQKSSVTAR